MGSPLLIVILLCGLLHPSGGGRAAENSAAGLFTTSNGLITAVVDGRTGAVTSLLPRVYFRRGSSRPVEPILTGFRLAGGGRPVRVGYLDNSHILRADVGSLTISFITPFTTGERVFYVAVEGESAEVERAAFTWEGASPGLRTAEVLFPRSGGRARRYLLFAAPDPAERDNGDLRPSRARLRTYSGSLLEDELQYMRMVIDGARLPLRLSREERDAAERSIASMKMAQVSPYERDAESQGGFSVGLPDSGQRIDPRSTLYGVLAFSRIGMYEEARNGLRSLLAAAARDTKPTGRESLSRAMLGMFLVAYSDFIMRSRDSVFLRETYPLVIRECAGPVTDAIRPNGLIGESGEERQETYGSVVCAAGLKGLAQLGRQFRGEEWRTWASAAGRLKRGILQHAIVGGKFLKGRVGIQSDEEGYYDPPTFEAFGMGVITDRALFQSHLRVYERREQTAVDLFHALRVASAMAKMGEERKAREIIRRNPPSSSGLLSAAYVLALSDLWE